MAVELTSTNATLLILAGLVLLTGTTVDILAGLTGELSTGCTNEANRVSEKSVVRGNWTQKSKQAALEPKFVERPRRHVQT